jgi:hypothetical protein
MDGSKHISAASAVLAVGHADHAVRFCPTLFTHDKDDAKISINTNTSTALEIEFSTHIPQKFRSGIRRLTYPFDTLPNLSVQ